MDELRGYVVQNSLPAVGEGQSAVARMNRRAELVTMPSLQQLLFDGRVYSSSDADENDTITGQTTYAATTPTLLLSVPAGTTALPLWVHLAQTGTVAGGVIEVYVSYDRVTRFSSGGTSEAISQMSTDRPRTPGCTLYSGATAAAATEARLLYSQFLDQDVTDPNTTEAIHLVAWRDFFPPLIQGAGAFLVFTVGATTGPTWSWSIGWAEFSDAEAL